MYEGVSEAVKQARAGQVPLPDRGQDLPLLRTLPQPGTHRSRGGRQAFDDVPESPLRSSSHQWCVGRGVPETPGGWLLLRPARRDTLLVATPGPVLTGYEGRSFLAVIGIIANPAASGDIRRLVAHGRGVPVAEKVNIIRRLLFGLESLGVRRVVAMPDASHLCQRARDDPRLSLDLDLLPVPVRSTAEDSVQAAALMHRMGVSCLVTLGGDGTNRAVAKGCGALPLVPISTGTNNVFPTMVEGTLAGLAAGVVARGLVDQDVVSFTSKRIEVYVDGACQDIALVDVAVSKDRFVASRALWDMRSLHEVFLTRAESLSIGLSSIGSRLHPVSRADAAGLYFRTGAGGTTVLAPVAPGLVSPVAIAAWRRLPLGQRVRVQLHPCTIALDGEREFSVLPGQSVEVVVNPNGPRVVQMEAVLCEANRRGVFTRQTGRSAT
ncbi:hypothetical protein NKDENANG_00350 [Candidatus Entotheonellaceae bacterium PAL068K]